MAANLENGLSAVEPAWTAHTPLADGSALSYRFVDTLIEERGDGQHREIIWELPQRGVIVAESPIRVEWSIDCRLFLHRRDRDLDAFRVAVGHEAIALVRSYSNLSALGTGVYEAHLDGFDVESEPAHPHPRSGGIERGRVARVIFHWRFLVGEGT
jgi:hypothetical protein